MNHLQFIDTRMGTRNQHSIGHGNTLPYTGVPFGMNHFVMQTRLNESRFFHPDDYTQYGVRLTHQPSPWMGDFCQVLFNQLRLTQEEYRQLMANPTENMALNISMSSYRPDEAIFQPHYLSYKRLRDGLKQSWTVGERGARWQVQATRTFPYHLLTITLDADSTVNLQSDGHSIQLETAQLAGSKYNQFQQYSILKSQCRLTPLIKIPLNLNQHDHVMYLFQVEVEQETIEMSLTTSYISYEQAKFNRLQDDFFKGTFLDGIHHSANKWLNYLERIDVKHRDFDQVKLFYHCLWRTATFPQMGHEVDSTNKTVHFSPYTGKVEVGHFFTNNGYWDTFRTNYPLYSLIIPSKIPEFIDGILSVVRADRYLPKWLSPDERGLMPGTLADGVIADAVTKGLIDKETASSLLEAMIDSANHAGEHATEGREGVAEYLSLGYLSTNFHESVNKTLDFAYSDFCISQVAAYLGKKELAEEYRVRARSYRHLFNVKDKQMVPRTDSGEWLETIDAHRWGEHYTEGSAWQNSLAVYHNIADLIALHGGDEEFFNHLNHLINQEPIYDVNGYGYEIHEMTEMARVQFGQLALSNQPSFHMPYLFIYAGYPQFSHLLIKQLITQLFSDAFDGYIGDEDNGSLSSWYVLSSLGLYPMTPGASQWTLGMMIWDEATIHLESGQKIELISRNYQTPYLQVVTKRWLNGKPYLPQYLSHQDLMKGVHLEQSLGAVPSIEKVAPALRPFSMDVAHADQ
ncbi:GH92 family glycosyl hydrolase [Globicatella sanguinis]|uniref:GH92 family glycosyl hydrolase n=1 Tax=Globicatella sanguinis TaxID=13076 RepID=UPI002542A52A|nr:GH92 family glycosyl hydrolase [Globicatella sanguinis]MDK7629931.1 GH92 family glycosyl hydrolase [Globicatella sanguinis]WIK66359.1 GH92 family glycosyl hydrolase [Globicatella sanguinis]WKT55764.1 GH92 family glycosyl hydrolase [Globicatella sanguinis]